MAEDKSTSKAEVKAAAATPVEVKTVVHEQDEELLKRHDIMPEGVLMVDEETYGKVARLGGFFNPRSEPTGYRPPLHISGLRGEAKENVLKVLSEGGKA
jgi:hypothetical protein